MTTQLLRTGVLTGCDVTAQAVPNMTVAVAAGSVEYQNASASVAAGNVTITTADATLDRQDAVVASSTGVLSAIAGTLPAAGDNALPPDTTGYVALAYVYVFSQASASYTGTIVASSIIPLVAQATQAANPLLIHTSPYRITGQWYGPPSTGSGATTWVSGEMYLIPFFTAKAMSIQAIGSRLGNPAATAGSKARFGIYQDDGVGTLTLLVDAGQVAADGGLGNASATISQTLAVGWWWFALAFQSLGATKPSLICANMRGATPIGANDLSAAATQVTGSYGGACYTGITGALPSSPSSPDYTKTQYPLIWVQAT